LQTIRSFFAATSTRKKTTGNRIKLFIMIFYFAVYQFFAQHSYIPIQVPQFEKPSLIYYVQYSLILIDAASYKDTALGI